MPVVLRTGREGSEPGTDSSFIKEPVGVNVTDDALVVELADGRTITVPLTWFPRLLHGSSQERELRVEL